MLTLSNEVGREGSDQERRARAQTLNRAPRLLLLDLDQIAQQSLAEVLGANKVEFECTTTDSIDPHALRTGQFDLVALEEGAGRHWETDPQLRLLRSYGLAFFVVADGLDERRAAQARAAGALAYLELPARWELLEQLLQTHQAMGASRATIDQGRGSRAVELKSQSMRRLMERLDRLVLTRSSVLISGESGVGKRTLARELHARSAQRGLWVEVDCYGESEPHLGQTLFGTPPIGSGAEATHEPGALQFAEQGTLFLHKVGQLPFGMQGQLLRQLESATRGPDLRAGSAARAPRVISSTSEDLRAAIDSGRIREDLYFALSTVELRVPSLRERPEDIEALAQGFLERQNSNFGTQTRWSQEALEFLRTLKWEGNIRELERFVERCFIWSDGPRVLELEAVQMQAERARISASVGHPLGGDGHGQVVLRVGESIPEAERKLIEATLGEVAGDKRKAAGILGISLKTLYSRLKRYSV